MPLLTPGFEYSDFERTGLQQRKALPVAAKFYVPEGKQPKGPKVRHNQWRYIDFDGDEDAALDFLATKLHSRSLTKSQKAMVAASITSLRPGRYGGATVPTQKDAAETHGVSDRLVRQAETVIKKATPELLQASRDCDTSLPKAA